MLLRKCVSNFLNFYKPWDFQRNVGRLFVLQQLSANPRQCNRNFSDTRKRSKTDEIPPTFSKYELFTEENTHTTLDVEEERQKIIVDDKMYDEFEGVNLQRGVDGIFDIEEIVSLLRKEKAEDLIVIKIPSEYQYADYLVIVNGRSPRHMLAMSDFIRRIYKKKLGSTGHIPKLEGKNSNTWMAIDLGNIILHVFSKPSRELYDLETLWTVGKEFDAISLKKTTSDVQLMTDYKKILASLNPKT